MEDEASESCGMFLEVAVPLFFQGVVLLGCDIVLYTVIAPLIAILIGSLILGSLSNLGYILSPSWEAVLVIVLTIIILNSLFRLPLEALFMKGYFTGSTGSSIILGFRDATNLCCIMYFAYRLFTVINTIGEDRGVPASGLYQGVPYVFLRQWVNQTHIEENWGYRPSSIPELQNITSRILEQYVPNFSVPEPEHPSAESKPTTATGTLPWILNAIASIWYRNETAADAQDQGQKAIPVPEPTLDNEFDHIVLFWKRAVNGADLLLCAAQLTATVLKLLYFHSLFNYMRAMRIMLEVDKKAAAEVTETQTDDRTQEEHEELFDIQGMPPFLRKEPQQSQQQEEREELIIGPDEESLGSFNMSSSHQFENRP